MFNWFWELLGLSNNKPLQLCEGCNQELDEGGDCIDPLCDFSSVEEEEEEEEEMPEPLPLSTYSPFHDVFYDVFKEVNEERTKAERDLLNDEKLRTYLKNSFKYLASQLVKDIKGTSMISSLDAKVPAPAWETYRKIFCGLCLELGINANVPVTSEYINVEMSSVKKAFDKMCVKQVDVDERIRAMLHKGPYR